MIGSEIEIDPGFEPPPDGPDIGAAMGTPSGRSAWFGSAREAVYWWAQHLKPPGPVLLPSYCCKSVVQPLSESDVEVRFYPVGADLQVDPAAVEPLTAGCAAIQVIHYFGFPAHPGLFSLGVPVLEDAVQALLSPWARASGSWAIASLRKFLPVPDGALLQAQEPFAAPGLPEARGGVYGRKLMARMLKHEARVCKDDEAWWEACRLLEETETALDGPIRPRAMSAWSRGAMQGVALGTIAAARRQNYQTLYQALFGSLGVTAGDQACDGSIACDLLPLFRALPAEVIPYGLPVVAERRDALGSFLADRGIYTVIHWELPEAIGRAEFPASWWLNDRILTLPIDHRYDQTDMAAIAAAIFEFLASDCLT